MKPLERETEQKEKLEDSRERTQSEEEINSLKTEHEVKRKSRI